MRYASVCSGIEAATLAWEPLGWEAVWFSQYDPDHNYSRCPDFPSAVLQAHWPTVPNLGNMLELKNQEVFKNEQFDLLVGGTPCQAFSIAGLRKGMDDKRGQLTLEFVRLLALKQPRWFVWENVPGVLNSNDGRDFAALLGALRSVGYSFSWRIIDAQYCGVPQRRRRVFVVGYLGADWRPSAAVLLERQSMPGHFAPSKSKRQAVAALTANSVGTCGADDNQSQAGHLIANPLPSGAVRYLTATTTATGRLDPNEQTFVVATLDASYGRLQGCSGQDLNHGHSHLVPYAFQPRIARNGRGDMGDLIHAISAQSGITGKGDSAPCVAFAQNSRNELRLEGGDGQRTGCLSASSSAKPGQGYPTIAGDGIVRRLTPVECERLQGMPDHHTNIIWKGKPAPDGQRYKAIGNSMAVPVMHWLGKRIHFIDKVINNV